MTNHSSTPTDRPTGWYLPLGVAAGAAIGMIVGILLGQLTMGLTIGAATGLLIATSLTSLTATAMPKRGRVLVAAVGLVTAGTLVILWLLWS